MRTPALAVLWESWQLSRLGLAIMVFVATFGGAALIVSPMDAGWSATLAMMLAGYLALIGHAWAGKVDARKGFSLALGFARPIPTWVLVSVPMAYVGVTCAVTYLVPVLILQVLFGIAFPLLPVAALLVTLSLAALAANWGTPKSAVRFVAPGLIMLAIMWYSTTLTAGNVLAPDRWPDLFSFSAWPYVWMALICVAAIGSTIAGVARQRRGDDGFGWGIRTAIGAAGRRLPQPLSRVAALVRLPCPVSSPNPCATLVRDENRGRSRARAGLLSAIVMSLVVTVVIYLGESGDTYVAYSTAALMFAPFVPLVAGFRIMPGVRRKQGVTYLSAFEATRPVGTARLVGLKVAVTSLAVLLSWIAIGTASWVLPGPLQRVARHPGAAEFAGDLPEMKADFSAGLLSATWVDLALLVAVLVAYVATLIASAGVVRAFFLRNARAVLVGGLLAAVYGVGLIYAFATGRPLSEPSKSSIAPVLLAILALSMLVLIFAAWKWSHKTA